MSIGGFVRSRDMDHAGGDSAGRFFAMSSDEKK
jgi:hypothetical protein